MNVSIPEDSEPTEPVHPDLLVCVDEEAGPATSRSEGCNDVIRYKEETESGKTKHSTGTSSRDHDLDTNVIKIVIETDNKSKNAPAHE